MATNDLQGPFKYNIYIGFSPVNKTTVHIVQQLGVELQRRKIICRLRDNLDIKSGIQDGVRKSQKCLIFLTSDYISDKWFEIETQELISKTERFSRDMVMIMRTDPSIEIPERLRGLTVLDFEEACLDNEVYLSSLVEKVTLEPNSELAILPKANIGYGAAFGYFYGYLRIVLPEFKNRLVDETLRHDPSLVPNTIKKMLIIIPESCFCQTSLITDGKIEFTDKYVLRVGHRAGNNNRDYKSSLFKLIDKENCYYFVGELATPLLTMYEMYDHGICCMTRDQLYMERDGFYFALKSILNHPDNVMCKNQFKILYWSDPKTEKENKLDLYDFLLPVLKDELYSESQVEKNHLEGSKPASSSGISIPETQQNQSTFASVEVHGCNPCPVYELGKSYLLDKRPRGKCLIVNFTDFWELTYLLSPREGADHDPPTLRKLFEDLHFEVEVHVNIDAKTLESVLNTTQLVDHSRYDAFICCVMSHGHLGVIYTSDGRPVEILQIADYFTDTNCPSLKGKPKLFFIQACQNGEPVTTEETLSQKLADTTLNKKSSDQTDAVREGNSDYVRKHKAVLVPGVPDFLVSYSTLPGSEAQRNKMTGSYYVQALNECLRRGLEIDRALKMVSHEVGIKIKQTTKKDIFQLPFHVTSGMDKHIFL